MIIPPQPPGEYKVILVLTLMNMID